MATQSKLTPIISLTGISTVGILTIGVTETAGGVVGIATTTYVRTALFHHAGRADGAATSYAGLGSATCSVYIYPHFEEVEGVG